LLAALALLAGCAQQPVRDQAARGARDAARQTVALEPGEPPRPQVAPLVVSKRARPTASPTTRAARGPGRDQQPAATPEYSDVWARIRAGRKFPIDSRARILNQIDWYQRNQKYIDRMSDRAALYLPYIVREVEKRGMPAELALLPIVESAFQPFAYSRAGASGIWQFIRSTGRRYGLRHSWWYDGRRDIVAATRAALDYLEALHAEFNGDWLLAIAAYNSGEGNVQRALRRNRRLHRPLDFWSLRLPRETQSYVPRLLGVAQIVAQPERYGLRLKPIPDRVAFAQVPIDSQIDLGLAARIADIPLDDIYRLNPGFNRFATDPEGPRRLLLPRTAAQGFAKRLAKVPVERRVSWRRHVVKSGETLGGIARRYRTSIAALRTSNRLHGARIVSGATLLIPVAKRATRMPRLSAQMRTVLARSTARSLPSKIYVVRRGDSLWRIARRNRMSVASLALLNGLSTTRVLRPRQRLRLSSAVPAVTKRKSATTRKRSRARSYVVRSGDSLWTIARGHGITVASLARWNSIGRSELLRPGRQLQIAPRARPVALLTTGSTLGTATTRQIAYTVRHGDSLWLISRRFRVSVAMLRQWNRLRPGQLLQPGQKLQLYVGVTEG